MNDTQPETPDLAAALEAIRRDNPGLDLKTEVVLIGDAPYLRVDTGDTWGVHAVEAARSLAFRADALAAHALKARVTELEEFLNRPPPVVLHAHEREAWGAFAAASLQGRRSQGSYPRAEPGVEAHRAAQDADALLLELRARAEAGRPSGGQEGAQ